MDSVFRQRQRLVFSLDRAVVVYYQVSSFGSLELIPNKNWIKYLLCNLINSFSTVREWSFVVLK